MNILVQISLPSVKKLSSFIIMRPYASRFVVVILLISIGSSVSFPVKIIQRINNGVGHAMIDIVVSLPKLQS